MNDEQALEDFHGPQHSPGGGEVQRMPDGLPDPEPLSRAARLLRTASAALSRAQSTTHLDPDESHDLHQVVCACQEPTAEWLVWNALDVLELIDMAA